MKKLLFFLITAALLFIMVSCGTVQEITVEETVHIHEFGEWVTIEPTCTLPGERTRECSCGKTQSETFSPKGHEVVYVAAKSATCIELGNNAFWYCTACQKKFTDKSAKNTISDSDVTLPLIGHSLSFHKETSSTCTKRGNIAYCDCSMCDGLFSADEPHAPLDEEEVFLPALPHSMTHFEARETACDREGVIEHWHCSLCNRDYAEEEGATYLESVIIPTLEHTYVDGICALCGEKDSYTVVFSTGDGKPVENMEVKKGTRLTTYPLTAKIGCAFLGWYTEENGTEPWLFDSTTVTGPTTLYARWMPTETAFMAFPVKSAQYANKIFDISFDGFTKEHVYNDSSCKKATDFNLTVTQNYLFIKYVPEKITLTVSAEGGYFSAEEYTRSLSFTLSYYTYFSLPQPIKRGFSLMGWKNAAGESFSKETYFCDGLSDVALRADWKATCLHQLYITEKKEPSCFEDGNIEYRYCAICGAYYSDAECTIDCWNTTLAATGHVGGEANCKEKAVCVQCGEEYGEILPHSGGKATCVSLAVCSFCGEEYGTLPDHIGGTATCVTLAVCRNCGEEYGEYAEHTPSEARCEEPIICSVCLEVCDSTILHHVYSDGYCTSCGCSQYLSYRFEQSKHGYLVTGSTSLIQNLVLPARIQGAPVIGVESGAFVSETSLLTITVPSSCAYFGENAFDGCTSLNAVYIEDMDAWTKSHFVSLSSNPLTYAKDLYLNKKKITLLTLDDCTVSDYAFSHLSATTVMANNCVISDYAFSYITATTVTLGDRVRYVGSRAFYGMPILSTVYLSGAKTLPYWHAGWEDGCQANIVLLDGSNLEISKSGLFLYRVSDNNAILTGYQGEETTVDVPSRIDGYTVIDIGAAFKGNSLLTTLYLPSTLTVFSSSSFSGCSNLIVAYVKESYESWKTKGLDDNSKLIFLINSSGLFGYQVSGNNAILTDYRGEGATVKVPAKVGDYTVIDIGTAFVGNSSLTTLFLPSTLTVLSTASFIGCDNLVRVYAQESYESWKGKGFGDYDKLAYLTEAECIHDSVVQRYRLDDNQEPVLLIPLPDYDRYRSCAYDAKEPLLCSLCHKQIDIETDIIRTHLYEDGFCTVCGEPEPTPGLTFVLEKDAYILTGYSVTPTGAVVIPSLYQGKPVEGIAEKVFNSCYITSVYIPKSILTIENDAFFGCPELTTVYYHAQECKGKCGGTFFDGCGPLTVYIGTEVKSIPHHLFGYADVHSLIFDTPSHCSVIGDFAFAGNPLTSVTLPASVSLIGFGAFRDCTVLQNVSAPDSILTIARSAFRNCSALTDIATGDKVTEVHSTALLGTAFYVDQPDGVIYLGKTACLYKGNASEIELQDGTLYIAARAFYGQQATSVTLPSSVLSIGAEAFASCEQLTNIFYHAIACSDLEDTDIFAGSGATSGVTLTVSPLVTYLPANLFYNLSTLTNVSADGVEEVGMNAFYGTAWLRNQTGLIYVGKALYASKNPNKTIVVREGTISIAAGAFAGQTAISELTLPFSLLKIGVDAFSGCTGIKQINYNIHALACGETSPFAEIGSSAGWTLVIGETAAFSTGLFRGAKYLKTVLFEESTTCTVLPEYLFAECPGLTEISLPDVITTICDYAFYKDTNLTKLALGKNITDLTGLAFGYCPLSEITSSSDKLTVINGSLVNEEQSAILLGSNTASDSGTMTAIDAYAFYARTGLTGFRINNDLISVGTYAFAHCSDLQFITIGKNVTILSDYAFSDCPSVDLIYYNAIDCIPLLSDNHLFEGMNVTVYVGNGVLSLPDYLFTPSEESIGVSFVVIGKDVLSIGAYALSSLTENSVVCYEGTAEEWEAVIKEEGNIFPSTVWFYSESVPLLNDDRTEYIGNYWHYDNGSAVLWIRSQN